MLSRLRILTHRQNEAEDQSLYYNVNDIIYRKNTIAAFYHPAKCVMVSGLMFLSCSETTRLYSSFLHIAMSVLWGLIFVSPSCGAH